LCGCPSISLRASPATSPARPSAACFFIRTMKIGSVATPVPRFRLDLGLHPSGEPRPFPAFQDTLGDDSGRKKCARNGEETFHASCDPDLLAREIGRRPHRLVFRASSSSPRIVFHARCKSCRQWTSSHAARQVNVRPPIYRGLPHVWPATFTHFSPNPLSTSPTSSR
jgi:hypothetical protein